MENKSKLEQIGNMDPGIHDADYKGKTQFPVLGPAFWVFDSGRNRESLNGIWHFSPDPYNNCLRSDWYMQAEKNKKEGNSPLDFDFESWDTVQIPHVWNLERPEWKFYEGPGVYERRFLYKSNGEDRVVLKFSGIRGEARIFLNGKFVGRHPNGDTAFFADITDFLQPENQLVITADNTRRLEQIPSENIDWFNYGGIFRDVELLRLPAAYISRFSLRLCPDDFHKIQGYIQISENVDGTAYLEIPELSVFEEITILSGQGTFCTECVPQLWYPESPKRYSATLRFGEDSVSDWIGLRDIRTQGRDILLNGKPIFLKAVCLHEESLTHGRAETEQEILERLLAAKEMGCNCVRLTHYPHAETAARLADRLGLLLWEEIGVYWWIDFTNAATLEEAQNQLHELIQRDENRASVILWSVGNENPDTDERYSFMRQLTEYVRQLDSSRLVTAACLCDKKRLIMNDRLAKHLDVIGVNEYYGWYDPDFSKFLSILENTEIQKPIIISEFGAGAACGNHGDPDNLWTEECQEEIYRRQIEIFSQSEKIKGTAPWVLMDFRSPKRLNSFQKGFNIKGLLSADLSYRKPAFYQMQKFYRTK